MAERPSVVVRAKDKAATIEATLVSIRAQTVPCELVVVDSGSTDGTVEIAKRHADQLVEIPASAFSYGGSLNLGTEVASGDVVFALSAHCVATETRWVEWSLEAYADPTVACTLGERHLPDWSPIDGPVRVGFDGLDLDRNPSWGLSNHASSWRRSVWEQHRFDEHLDACEDKEWMWWALQRGHAIVVDPRLYVSSGHRRDQGTRALYERSVREARALSRLLDREVPSRRATVRRWWSDFPYPSRFPKAVRRLGPARTAEIFGRDHGTRVGAAARDETTLPRELWAGR